jgi:structure-specific recognition protein 1
MEGQAGPVLQYANVSSGGKAGGTGGAVRISTNGVAWRPKGGVGFTLAPSDILSFHWVNIGPSFQLRIATKGRQQYKFDGFKISDYEALNNFVKEHFKAELQSVEVPLKGWNWGDLEFTGNDGFLAFKVDGKPAFEIPVSDVAQANLASKTDVTFEFHSDDTHNELKHDMLAEMRLYIPNTNTEEGASTSAEELHKKILQKADIVSVSGSGIVVFPDVPMVYPRGRYEVEMFGTFVRLHGKTHDYKVLYTNISRLYMLTRSPEDPSISVVVSLDQPIRQGQTRYPHLVFSFPRGADELALELNMSEVPVERRDKLQERMSGRPHELFVRIFKELADKKVSGPGTFKTKEGMSAIKCALKASDGFLFPLERAFFFIPKPPTLLLYEDVSFVEFSRVSDASGSASTSTRNFDLIVNVKSGTSHQFTNIQRGDYSPLFKFMTDKKIKIRGSQVETPAAPKAVVADLLGDEDESSEADEDFAPKEEEEESAGEEEISAEEESGGGDGEKKRKAEKADGEKKGKKSKSKDEEGMSE